MKYPWSNVLLLALVLVELASGFFGLLSGAPDRAVFVQAHRVAGYALLVLLFWKGGNILFSLRWRRPVVPRTASLTLLSILIGALALGLWWTYAGPYGFGLFSGLSWHIYVGAALVPILAWHAVYHTRGFPLTFWADRRSFLRLGGIAIAGLALWQLGEVGARSAGLRGASRRFSGSYEAPRRADGAFPVVSWLNDRPAPVDVERWRLTVRGAVEREIVLGYEDLAPDSEMTATIDCTGGWYSTQEWRGVALAQVLGLAGPLPNAASVTVTSVTGYYRRFSLNEAKSYVLATHVGGRRLSHGHGYPLRLAAPGKRGFEWVKWIVRIDVNETPKWLQPPLPLQ